MVAQYRKKPAVIEAAQFTGGAEAATPIIDWILSSGGTARYHEDSFADDTAFIPEHIAIDTLEGTMRADRSDWIIRGVQGEFYPCKPEIFAATYDAVKDRSVELAVTGVGHLGEAIADAVRKATQNPGKAFEVDQ